MMDSEQYSSYPEELEMLLKEGIEVMILDCIDNFTIENEHKSMKEFKEKRLTVICMYIPW